MAITTLPFMVFVFGGALVYYIVPKKVQWIWLLILSCAFYWTGGKDAVFYIIFTSLSVWIGAKGIRKFRENTRKQKAVYLAVLLSNLGILIAIKGIIFANAMQFFGGSLSAFIVPFGVSFYTLQAVSYLTDVYWGKLEPEDNFLRMLLYLSFFPQIVQGPIARYNDLGRQLSSPHSFDIDVLEAGILRMLWGFFKKAVIADRLYTAVGYVFDDVAGHSAGMIFVGAVLYAIQQYADFSGGIDIVAGAAKVYDIDLAPNFERPYFSRSLGEFWRRWHISLGAWMKDYVFYPFSVAAGTRKLTKWAKKRFGKQTGKVLPIVLGNILVFFLVGIWHGYYMHFVAWGLYNGIIIAFSAAMEPVWKKCRSALRVRDDSRGFAVFGVIRTFLIVVFGGLFDRALNIRDALFLWGRFFTGPYMLQSSLYAAASTAVRDCFGMGQVDLAAICAAILILFGCEFYEELTGNSVREKLFAMPLIIRWIILLAFIYFIVLFHVDMGNVAEFMYAEF